MYESIPAIIREASKIMLCAHDIDSAIEEKIGSANFVTKYDIAVQKFLCEKLTALLPDHIIIGEESSVNPTELIATRKCIIIDPIDGTTNFMHNYRHSAISVGVCDCGTMVYGAVFDPYLDRMLLGEKGRGAYLESGGTRTKISVSDRALENGLVAFGTSPYYRDELGEKTFRSAEKLFYTSRDIRRAGAASLDLCDTACGSIDAFFEYRLSPWDYAAASLIIEEAGGVITQIDGSPLTLDAPCSVIAGNPTAHAQLLSGNFFE